MDRKNPRLIFDTSNRSNDLQGPLSASIQFAQSQVFPVKPKPGDRQPYLTARRKTLLLAKPLSSVSTMRVSVADRNGELLGSLSMNSPDQLPKTIYYDDDVPDDWDFNPPPGLTYVLSDSEIPQLIDPEGVLLLQKIQQYALVEIPITNDQWILMIFLPSSASAEGKVARVQSSADKDLFVLHSGRPVLIRRGESHQFKCIAGRWIHENELINQALIYSDNTWSVELPADWIKVGITMQFDGDDLSGQLNDIHVGAETELLIHTIDIGMLTTPRDEYVFAKDPLAQGEYFQTVPITRMIVSNYQSLYLREVMFSNGTLLTDFDPSEGGWHTGDMRQRTGKELISLGINHANYGINSSAGQGEATPYIVAQLTAHNNRGKYVNGVQVHGGSGGASMVTLEASLGNELSHEVGHNYGLTHYPSGFSGSVHRPADAINSTWGWDSNLARFIPCFEPNVTHRDACHEDTCQAPFHGRAFGYDPMAGGRPMSERNRFTLHTPYTATLTQAFMESKAVFASDSHTGFRKWNPHLQCMEPYRYCVEVLQVFNISPFDDISEGVISARLEENDVVRAFISPQNWASEFHAPPASAANNGRVIQYYNGAESTWLYINDQSILMEASRTRGYLSNGLIWVECVFIDAQINRGVAPADELSESAIANLLAIYHFLSVIVTDGHAVRSIYVPNASPINYGRVITIESNSVFNAELIINGLIIAILPKDRKYYISGPNGWHSVGRIVDACVQRIPRAFGVPVTTLVGYVDPQNELQSYIYPALHGAYGFLYPDDNDSLIEADCQLAIESGDAVMRFKLFNYRVDGRVMNKFHINIAESALQRTAILYCSGNEVARRSIEPATEVLHYTLHGEAKVLSSEL
ncbi:M66 family metalloprotease [Pseudomonas thivervalensis]|uniref:M66 family metalloprotease n=1 Tax=Pseudomonas thivervalensis TaxID=86265 RepID=UPI003D6B8E43